MSTILLTGFEAFGSTPINPAEQVALRLDGEDSLEADERDRLEAAFHGLFENLQGGEAGK